jgi:Tol biopolymer transport system component
LSALALLSGAGIGCGNRVNVQCEISPNCNLTTGGICELAPTGNHWCAYADSSCPGGARYADQDVGDGLSGQCVPVSSTETDAGIEPDGGSPVACDSLVAFITGLPGSTDKQIWLSHLDGSYPVNVSNDPASDNSQPSWTPDGKRLIFLSNRNVLTRPGFYQLYQWNSDGSSLTNLTPHFTDAISWPALSPDGKHIAFFAGNKPWVMNSDGTNAVPLANTGGVELAWSPDSTRIVFGVFSGVFISLHVVSIDASAPETKLSVASESTFEMNAAWAPGQQVLWNALNGDLFAASPDTHVMVNITQDSDHVSVYPIPTPDGQTVIFQSDISGHPELWSVPTSGGSKSPLTHNTVTIANNGGFYGDVPNSISKDGKLVALSRVLPGENSGPPTADIGILDVDSLIVTFLNAPGASYASNPKLSPCVKRPTMLTSN